MLHPDLRSDDAIAALRDRWREARSLRIDRFLDPAATRELRDAFRDEVFSLTATPAWNLSYQYLRFAFQPQEVCDHVACRFGRWLRSEGTDVIRRITGLDISLDPDEELQSTLYGKGCFLETHNDHDGYRRVAYTLGLTEAAWPAEEGGHLEFLAGEGDGVRVLERRAPGWGSLDLFEVSDPDTAPLHRIPLLTQAHERRAMIGWLVSPDDIERRRADRAVG